MPYPSPADEPADAELTCLVAAVLVVYVAAAVVCGAAWAVDTALAALGISL